MGDRVPERTPQAYRDGNRHTNLYYILKWAQPTTQSYRRVEINEARKGFFTPESLLFHHRKVLTRMIHDELHAGLARHYSK